MRTPFRGVAVGAWVALAACSQGAAPPDPKLWTLFDVEALYAGGAPAGHGLAAADGLPGGIPLGEILDDTMRLVPQNAWADGYQTSYVTTEVWSNFDRVWMQPAYVPVTGWQGGMPQKLLDGGAWHPIFSVGPKSGFYSPFWQIVYAEVPADTSPGALTSGRQILEGGYPLTPSEGRTMPLCPDGIVGAGKAGTGWLDGAPISFLDFGTATFTWDEANVVQEIPLYVFTVTGSDGQPHVLPEMPKVLGTAPPGAPAGAPPTVGGDGVTPRYSAFWRLYTVPVPSFATIFAPPGSDLASDLAAMLVPTSGKYSPNIVSTDPNALAPFLGRVSVTPIDPNTGLPPCFASLATLPSCHWIEVQADLEANLDVSTNEATGITVTSPVIDANGNAVTPL